MSRTAHLVLALIGLVGCSVNSTSAADRLDPLETAGATTSTVPRTTDAPTTTDAGRPVVGVLDGRTFDVQGQVAQRITIPHITVAPILSCEGVEARNALSSIISGHPIRVHADGSVWWNGVDVGLAMVNYGYAKAADGRYAKADYMSPDFSCSSTTTPRRGP